VALLHLNSWNACAKLSFRQMRRAAGGLYPVASRAVLVGACSVLLVACGTPFEQLSLPGPITPPSGLEPDLPRVTGKGLELAKSGVPSTSLLHTYTGSGEFADVGGAGNSGPTKDWVPNVEAPTSGKTADGLTINLSGASIAEVSKTVLGDILGVNFSVSEKLKGTITLRTAHPVSKNGLLEIFEAVLHNEGATLVVRNGLYEVLPSAEAAANGTPLRRETGSDGNSGGAVTEIVPLRFVSATEMERVLRTAVPQAGILRVDTARNMIVISGSAAELSGLDELIEVFDVDWMRGMSFALFPVETSDPESIARELDTIFANDRDSPTKGLTRFIGNRRLKSVLVISTRPEYVHKADVWIKRIDRVSQETQKQVHVYHVQHRAAADLAKLLQKVYTGGQSGSQAASLGSASAAPGAGAAAPLDPSRSAPNGSGSVGSAASSAATGGAPASAAGATPAAATSLSGDAALPADPGAGATGGSASAGGSAEPADDRNTGISVSADEANNSLVVTATTSEYRRVLHILETLDTHPNEVLLEATIAEVTLNDQLQFGVRWFFQNKSGDRSLSFTDASGVVPSVASAGLSYLIKATDIKLLINALSNVTNVDLLSHPSLMVLENRKASLQVGDQVPILTQTQQTASAATATTTSNSVSYRNTGILLNITPRVGSDGTVLLELEQEVSDTKSNTSSGIDSPAFTQRRIQTTVSVKNGETIILAGMIQDKSTRSRDQVPILGDIPFIGNAFKNKSDSIVRTELLIAITPQVIKDSRQLTAVTEELRDSLNFSTRPQRAAGPDRKEDLSRLLR
jgi:general secretion pathway protein D